MSYILALKNSDRPVTIDHRIFSELREDPYLSSVGFLDNLRLHSSGCVVFQKTTKCEDGPRRYRTKTIYLHKLIAERFLADTRLGENKLVGAINGNKLDCRLENLEYRSRSIASRKRKSSSRLGYTGVYQEHNRYRAVISVNGRSIHIGMFATPEEAALAYNEKSVEIFGDTGKINVIRPHAASGELDSVSMINEPKYRNAPPEVRGEQPFRS